MVCSLRRRKLNSSVNSVKTDSANPVGSVVTEQTGVPGGNKASTGGTCRTKQKGPVWVQMADYWVTLCI